MLNVVECATLSGLESLRGEWDSLLAGAAGASIFSTWEWVEACWRYAEPSKEPFILVARDPQGHMQGVLPLARTRRLGVVSMVEVLGCTAGGYPLGDYGGLTARRGAEGSVWAAMLRYLRTSHWSVIDLRNCRDFGFWILDFGLKKDSQSGSALADTDVARRELSSNVEPNPKSKIQNPKWDVRVTPAEVCRVIDLPATFDEYLAGLSSNGRQNVRRKLRKLKEAGLTIEQVDVLDEGARNAALEAMFGYHQSRWSESESGGVFATGRDREMHRHLAANMAARGWLDLRVARSADGTIVGVIYNFRRDGVAFYYQMGTNQDAEWGALSLGFCLLADSVSASIAEGCHTFDLLRGDHEYKRHFGGRLTNNLRVTVYRYGWLPKVEESARALRRMLTNRSQVTSHKPALERSEGSQVMVGESGT